MKTRRIWLLLTTAIVLPAVGLYVLLQATQPSEDPSAIYDSEYFEAIQPGSARSASRVVPELVDLLSPQSVVDVGCGLGAWLAEFQKHGVSDVLGIDGDWIDRSTLQIPPQLFLAHDLRRSLSLHRKFDLALSLEVAEHLPPEVAEQFVSNLAALAPLVLFSAAIPYQEGNGHLNEQWPEHWARIFAKFGFAPLDYLRFKFWSDPQIDWWYRQNMILYARRDYIEAHPRLKAVLEGQPPEVLRLVHPEAYMQSVTRNHEPGLRSLLGALPGAIARMIKRRLPWLLGYKLPPPASSFVKAVATSAFAHLPPAARSKEWGRSWAFLYS